MKKTLVIAAVLFFSAIAANAQFEIKKTQDANSSKTRTYRPIKYKPIMLKSSPGRNMQSNATANNNRDRLGNFEIQHMMSEMNNADSHAQPKNKRRIRAKKS